MRISGAVPGLESELNVLVTGAAGFIGRALVGALAQRADVSRILAFDQADAAIALFKELDAQPASGFHGRSQWYLFLAYVRAGKAEDAKAMKLEDDRTYGERVRAITSKLN